MWKLAVDRAAANPGDMARGQGRLRQAQLRRQEQVPTAGAPATPARDRRLIARDLAALTARPAELPRWNAQLSLGPLLLLRIGHLLPVCRRWRRLDPLRLRGLPLRRRRVLSRPQASAPFPRRRS